MTKAGTILYKMSTTCGKFIASHPILYFILNYTWGLIGVIIGWICTLFFMTIKQWRMVPLGRGYHFLSVNIDEFWGFSIGVCPIICQQVVWSLYPHEFGHTVQNAIFGPFQLFLVLIPSCIRFWYREWLAKTPKHIIKTKYDDIWFEGSATIIGETYFDIVKK